MAMTRDLGIAIGMLLLGLFFYMGMILEGVGSYPVPKQDLKLSLTEAIQRPTESKEELLHDVLVDRAGPIERNPFDLSSDVQERGMTISMPRPRLPLKAPPALILWEGVNNVAWCLSFFFSLTLCMSDGECTRANASLARTDGNVCRCFACQ